MLKQEPWLLGLFEGIRGPVLSLEVVGILTCSVTQEQDLIDTAGPYFPPMLSQSCVQILVKPIPHPQLTLKLQPLVFISDFF